LHHVSHNESQSNEQFPCRRTFLAAVFPAAALTAIAASGCSHKRASRYQGWLFAASGTEKTVTVANLAQFRTITRIALPHAPDQLAYTRNRVYALSGEGAELIEIEPKEFQIAGRMALPGRPVSFHILPDGDSAIVVIDNPPAVLRVDLAERRVVARLPLAGLPGGLDTNADVLAITIPALKSILRVNLPQFKLLGATATGVPCETVRFRGDGKTILAGAPAARQLVTVDSASGKLLVRLPMPVAPSRFCFNPDGGQMFVSGAGEDSVAIVSPYQNEVGETMLAGRTPGAMAVSANLLFVANPGSGDLTILDIDTRHLAASVHVGGNPGEVLITPDGEYALVLDAQSGNCSVVRILTVMDRKVKTKPLFTVFPMAANAHSAVIVPFG
jgi:YVTN family beta-propeller protein